MASWVSKGLLQSHSPIQRRRKKNRFLKDIDPYAGYWFVSDRAKIAFEACDPDGFEFDNCEVLNRKNGEKPTYWICGITRDLDAIDEEQSDMRIRIDERTQIKFYDFGYSKNNRIRMKSDVIKGASIFYVASQETIVCDEKFRDAYKAAGLTGLRFVQLPNAPL